MLIKDAVNGFDLIEKCSKNRKFAKLLQFQISYLFQCILKYNLFL